MQRKQVTIADTEKQWETDILLVAGVPIPVRSEAFVEAKLRKETEGANIVCEPLEIDIGQVYVASCLINKTERLRIRVIDVSNKKIRLQKKPKLAKAMTCEMEEKDEVSRMIGKINLEEKNWAISGFSIEHLDEITSNILKKLIREYSDLFIKDDETLNSTTMVKNGITLEPRTQPICKAPYRIPYHQR